MEYQLFMYDYVLNHFSKEDFFIYHFFPKGKKHNKKNVIKCDLH